MSKITPKLDTIYLDKAELIAQLERINKQELSRTRIFEMENSFKEKMQSYKDQRKSVENYEYRINPFAAMLLAFNNGYTSISQIEGDVMAMNMLSMATSMGKMMEQIVLPAYGWDISQPISSMHTSDSIIDGVRLSTDVANVVTLKSGPRTLNDSNSRDISNEILRYYKTWAATYDVSTINFIYGVWYGTYDMSNRKDWHILHNVYKGLDNSGDPPYNKWNMDFSSDGIDVNIQIRIGLNWWEYLGGNDCLSEVLIALTRASIDSSDIELSNSNIFRELIEDVPANSNIEILHPNQLQWCLFLHRHFYDSMITNSIEDMFVY
jgi:hypothetical protein